MRRVTAMVSAAAVVLWMATVFAQGTNFRRGRGQRMHAGAAAGGGGGAAGGGGGGGGAAAAWAGRWRVQGPMVVKQDATTLSVKRQDANGATTTIYTLDGKPHEVTQGQGTATVTAKVEGATIVIDTDDRHGHGPTTRRQVCSMAAKLTIVPRTRPRGGDAATRDLLPRRASPGPGRVPGNTQRRGLGARKGPGPSFVPPCDF